jgi:hypothetical protein
MRSNLLLNKTPKKKIQCDLIIAKVCHYALCARDDDEWIFC